MNLVLGAWDTKFQFLPFKTLTRRKYIKSLDKVYTGCLREHLDMRKEGRSKEGIGTAEQLHRVTKGGSE